MTSLTAAVAMGNAYRNAVYAMGTELHLATFIIKYRHINSFLWFENFQSASLIFFRLNFQRTFLPVKKRWQLDTIKNVKHVYYLLLWKHLWTLSQNLWNKRGVKNMTIRHTSRRVDGRSVHWQKGAAATACRAAVSLPQAGGSEVVILSSTRLS